MLLLLFSRINISQAWSCVVHKINFFPSHLSSHPQGVADYIHTFLIIFPLIFPFFLICCISFRMHRNSHTHPSYEYILFVYVASSCIVHIKYIKIFLCSLHIVQHIARRVVNVVVVAFHFLLLLLLFFAATTLEIRIRTVLEHWRIEKQQKRRMS